MPYQNCRPWRSTVPLPKEYRLLVHCNGRLDTLQADFEEVIEGELDRMTNP
jgi:hypothetical protein